MTSSLSGTRSNQLSYEPFRVEAPTGFRRPENPCVPNTAARRLPRRAVLLPPHQTTG